MWKINSYEVKPFFDEITTKIVALVLCGSLVLLVLAVAILLPEITDYTSVFLIFWSIVFSSFILIKKIFNSKFFHLFFWFQLSILFCFFILIFGRTYYVDLWDNVIIFLEIFISVVFLLFLAFIKKKKYYYFLLIFITILWALIQYNNFSIFFKHSSTETYTIQEKYIYYPRKAILAKKYYFTWTSFALWKINDDVSTETYISHNAWDDISVNYYKWLIGLDFYRY